RRGPHGSAGRRRRPCTGWRLLRGPPPPGGLAVPPRAGARPNPCRGGCSRAGARPALLAGCGVRRKEYSAPVHGRPLPPRLQPLGRRAACDGAPRRRRASCAWGARARIGRAGELLGGPRGGTGAPALHATGTIPRMDGAGRAPLGEPFADREVETTAEETYE